MKKLFTFALVALCAMASTMALAVDKAKEAVVSVATRANDVLFGYMGRAGFALFAIVTVKSSAITNRDAVPAVINDGRLERATLESATGVVAIGAADSITSYYPMCAIPSSAMVRDISASCPAGMTTLAGNIGVFKNTKDSGGVALGTIANTGSGTFFGSAQSFATAQNRTDVTNQSGNNTAAKREQPIWQAIGLTVDPNTTFDIGITVTTANTGAAGFIALEARYADNSN